MSCVEIYAINRDGDVVDFGEARNSHGYAPHIWEVLSQKLCGTSFPWSSKDVPVWKKFRDPSVSENERIVLGATYDAVWIKRENIPRLVTALEAFWEKHATIYPQETRPSMFSTPVPVAVYRTIPALIEILVKIAADDKYRGVCFNATSVNGNPWRVREPQEGEDYDDDPRAFNFDKDTQDTNGNEPWELFEAVDSVTTLRPRP